MEKGWKCIIHSANKQNAEQGNTGHYVVMRVFRHQGSEE